MFNEYQLLNSITKIHGEKELLLKFINGNQDLIQIKSKMNRKGTIENALYDYDLFIFHLNYALKNSGHLFIYQELPLKTLEPDKLGNFHWVFRKKVYYISLFKNHWFPESAYKAKNLLSSDLITGRKIPLERGVTFSDLSLLS